VPASIAPQSQVEKVVLNFNGGQGDDNLYDLSLKPPEVMLQGKTTAIEQVKPSANK